MTVFREFADPRLAVLYDALGPDRRATLTLQLRTAGFSVQHVYGDWDRRPAGPQTPQMIFVAVRR